MTDLTRLTKRIDRSCPFEADEAYAAARADKRFSVIYQSEEACYLLWDMKAEKWVADPATMPKRHA